MIAALLACLVAGPLLNSFPADGEPDGDGDGLSDFHELHKYGTDPRKADSDGDGIEDGDWLERREYAYTVRSIVQVMRPVTIEYLCDDFQDVRVLHEGQNFVELEVVHYPFNTVNATIEASDDWRWPNEQLKPWLAPGPTSDWTPQLREELLADLLADGIDVGTLSDKSVVQQVSAWLMQHADTHDAFSSFITSFDEEGRRELSASGIFETGLRALGIPTRTVLCIPLVDASDAREREWVQTRLSHNQVRPIVAASAERNIRAWTSHTFNEVWVGGRWRRLNYKKLGQGILDEHYLGLIAQVEGQRDRSALSSFLSGADSRVWLEAAGHPRLGIALDAGCWWLKNNTAYVYLPFGTADRRAWVEGVPYRASARNGNSDFRWELDLQVMCQACV